MERREELMEIFGFLRGKNKAVKAGEDAAKKALEKLQMGIKSKTPRDAIDAFRLAIQQLLIASRSVRDAALKQKG